MRGRARYRREPLVIVVFLWPAWSRNGGSLRGLAALEDKADEYAQGDGGETDGREPGVRKISWSCRPQAAGSSRVKQMPPPGSDAVQSTPPCSRASPAARCSAGRGSTLASSATSTGERATGRS